jgi:hypothetical protein
MSTEVDSHMYQHLPEEQSASVPTEDLVVDAKLLAAVGGTKRAKQTSRTRRMPVLAAAPAMIERAKPQPPFIYSPLHDMESLWWLSLYLLIARRYYFPGTTAVDDDFEKQMDHQAMLAQHLFYNAKNRALVMAGIGNTFRQILDELTLHSVAYTAGLELNKARSALRELFREAEVDTKAIKFSTVCSTKKAGNLYTVFFHVFQDISNDMAETDCHVVVDNESTKVRKRGRADDMENQRIGDKRHAVTMVDAESSQPLPSLLSYAQSHKARKMHKDSTPGSSSRRPDTESDGSR